QVFVACLPCSHLVYAEATWTQGQEDWLGSHVRALAAIGGCPEKLVPDNLRSGVTDASYYDPVLNRAYQQLAQHYGIAVVPARVRRPRDKSSVEGAVKHEACGALGTGTVAPPSVPVAGRGQRRDHRTGGGVEQPPVQPAAGGQPPRAVRGDRAPGLEAIARRAVCHRPVAGRPGER
ncbi:transposase family protein, partial [Rhodovastum atsumiense]